MRYTKKNKFTTVRIIAIIAVVFMLAPVVKASEKCEDSKLGFMLSLPVDFKKYPSFAGTTPDVVHTFILGNPADIKQCIILFIERMHGTIGRERLAMRQMPHGFNGSLITARWKMFEIDGLEVPETIQGTEFVTYNVQIPLKHEAIQLKLFGTMQQKDRLKALLTEILNGLEGESNWIPSANESSVVSASYYGTILLIIGIISIIGGLLALWLISRITPKGTILFLALLLYTVGVVWGDIRVREVVLFSGIMKTLGFAGVILGIIDILRKRTGVVAKEVNNVDVPTCISHNCHDKNML